MTTQPNKEPPRYTEASLIKIVRETKNIEDLCKVGQLYKDLQEAGDIDITQKIILEVEITQQQHIFGKRIQDNNNN